MCPLCGDYVLNPVEIVRPVVDDRPWPWIAPAPPPGATITLATTSTNIRFERAKACAGCAR